MAGLAPLLLLGGGRRGFGGRGMIKKVLMYSILGPMALLLGGGFSIMDFVLIPMIAPMFKGLLSGLTGGLGGVAPVTTGSLV